MSISLVRMADFLDLCESGSEKSSPLKNWLGSLITYVEMARIPRYISTNIEPTKLARKSRANP